MSAESNLDVEDPQITQIRQSVIALCGNFPGEYWRDLDQKREYPTAFVRALTEAGFLAVLIPEEYGGSGLGLTAAAAVLEEIQRSGCNGAACHAQMYIMGTILRHGSAEQKARWLPRIASGELRLQAFGVSEPSNGTDTLSLKTRAVRQGDHYVVNGQKIWTSRAEHSDLMLLLARTTPKEEAKSRSHGLSVFVVDMQKAVGNGMTIKPIRTMINHSTTQVFFDDMKVPAENLLGEEGKGFKYLLHGLNPERVLIAAEAVGLGRVALKRAVQYAKERVVFDRPIGMNQGIQHPLAKCWMDLEAANLMMFKAAALYDAGLPCGAEANTAKYLASEAGYRACEQAVLTLGGMGYAKEFQVERYFREIMISRIAPVSREMILNFVSEQVLELPKSY